jgi:hypothetical protein
MSVVQKCLIEIVDYHKATTVCDEAPEAHSERHSVN